MIKFVVFITCTFFLSSCFINIVNDNYYSHLTQKQQSKIKHLSVFDEAQPGNIYKIAGKQLSDELKNHDKSIVYTFVSNCSGNNIALKEIKEYAEKNDFKLFLVLTDYFGMDITLQENLDIPIYSINNEAYDEPKSRKYYKIFRDEIGYFAYKETLDGNRPGRFLIYKKNKLVDSKNYLSEVQVNTESSNE